MKNPENNSKKKIIRWTRQQYKDAVLSLRNDSRFIGFDPKDNFNLKDVAKWSSKKRKDIREAIEARHYLDIREKVGTVFYVQKKSRTWAKSIQTALGYNNEAISLKHVRHIPITKPAHIPASDMRVKFDKDTGILAVSYKQSQLETIRVPINWKPIFEAVDFSQEEELYTDAVAHEVRKQLTEKAGEYMNNDNMYRIATYAGELNGIGFRSTNDLDAIINDICDIVEAYFDKKDGKGNIMVSGITIYRNIFANDDTDYQLRNMQGKIANADVKPEKSRFVKLKDYVGVPYSDIPLPDLIRFAKEDDEGSIKELRKRAKTDTKAKFAYIRLVAY